MTIPVRQPATTTLDGPPAAGATVSGTTIAARDAHRGIPYGTAAGCCPGPPERRRSGFDDGHGCARRRPGAATFGDG